MTMPAPSSKLNVGEADQGGKADMVNVFEDDSYASSAAVPNSWNWSNWPAWWHHFNGIGRITWNLKLEPAKDAVLNYTWHYYMQ